MRRLSPCWRAQTWSDSSWWTNSSRRWWMVMPTVSMKAIMCIRIDIYGFSFGLKACIIWTWITGEISNIRTAWVAYPSYFRVLCWPPVKPDWPCPNSLMDFVGNTDIPWCSLGAWCFSWTGIVVWTTSGAIVSFWITGCTVSWTIESAWSFQSYEAYHDDGYVLQLLIVHSQIELPVVQYWYLGIVPIHLLLWTDLLVDFHAHILFRLEEQHYVCVAQGGFLGGQPAAQWCLFVSQVTKFRQLTIMILMNLFIYRLSGLLMLMRLDSLTCDGRSYAILISQYSQTLINTNFSSTWVVCFPSLWRNPWIADFAASILFVSKRIELYNNFSADSYNISSNPCSFSSVSDVCICVTSRGKYINMNNTTR